MPSQVFLVALLVGVGLSVSGAATHLYQAVSDRPAALRYDGGAPVEAAGQLMLSLLCGPYILLGRGLQPFTSLDGASRVGVVAGGLIAIGWAFLTGLLLLAAVRVVFG